MATIKMKVDNSKINEIADAIREKLGTTIEYTIDEMPDAIRSIENVNSGGAESGFDGVESFMKLEIRSVTCTINSGTAITNVEYS